MGAPGIHRTVDFNAARAATLAGHWRANGQVSDVSGVVSGLVRDRRASAGESEGVWAPAHTSGTGITEPAAVNDEVGHNANPR